jgi:hypothetical protein
MVTELEQEFYRVFEISPATIQEYGAAYFWETIEIDGKRYTPIDDHKLLEMICILNNCSKYDCWGVTVARLKNAILENCLMVKDDIKSQIQQLFKE